MKILITGGCGFVGSNLAIYFKQNQIGTEINSLDNLSRGGSILNLNRLNCSIISTLRTPSIILVVYQVWSFIYCFIEHNQIIGLNIKVMTQILSCIVIHWSLSM